MQRRHRCRLESLEPRALLTATLMSFQDGLYPDAAYDGTRDIRIEEFDPHKNYNYSDKLEMDGAPENATTLLRWDISNIPADAILQSVSITVNVTDPTSDLYEIYEVLRPWAEDQATWTEAATGSSWETSGAQGGLDRGGVVLGAITASSRGLTTVQLNQSGIEVVQRWLRDPSTNHGLIVQDFSEDNGLDFRSREAPQADERPRLDITYAMEETSPPPVESDKISFQDGAYPSADYLGTLDVRISSGSPDKNYNYSDTLWVDGAPADIAALLRWDISQISTDAVLESVSITVNVVDSSSDTYEIYELLRPWSEGQATWSQAADGSGWQTAGAQGDSDRGAEVLGVISAASKGLMTIELNQAGIAAVQRWVSDPSTNHGLVVQDYVAATNGLDFHSRETSNAAERPRLDIRYGLEETPPPPAETSVVSFQDGAYPSVEYLGTLDVRISSGSPDKNYNYSDTLWVDGAPADIAALLRWDISQIPTDAVLESVSITVNVVDPSSDTYEIYELLRPWSEGQATWSQAADGSGWQTAGAQGDSDRGAEVLGVISAASRGLMTIELNQAGIAAVQRWVSDPSTNHGLVVQDYVAATNGLDFHSRETSNAAERPRLTLVYAVSTTALTAESQIASEESVDLMETEIQWGAMPVVEPEVLLEWETRPLASDQEPESGQPRSTGRGSRAMQPWGVAGPARRVPGQTSEQENELYEDREPMDLDLQLLADVSRAWTAGVVDP